LSSFSIEDQGLNYLHNVHLLVLQV